jgi:hypothetical protein
MNTTAYAHTLVPAQAGTQELDSRLRGNERSTVS